MTLGKTLSFTQPQFPHLQNGFLSGRAVMAGPEALTHGRSQSAVTKGVVAWGGVWAGGSQASDSLLCPPCLQPSEFEEEASRRVDDLLGSYMGIRDPELGKGPG